MVNGKLHLGQTITMKHFITLAFILASLCAFAQPASITHQIDILVTTTDTVLLQARQTHIVFEVNSLSPTLTIDAPSAHYRNFRVTIVQLSAGSGEALILDSLGIGSEFQASNTATSSFTFTSNTYEIKTFACLQVASETWKWVLIQ